MSVTLARGARRWPNSCLPQCYRFYRPWFIQITMKERNSIGRIFRGRYRKAGSHYHPLRLRDLLLRHSYFSVGTEILVQHRGASISMGSPMAPSMCGAAAALWGATFHHLIRDQFLYLPDSSVPTAMWTIGAYYAFDQHLPSCSTTTSWFST